MTRTLGWLCGAVALASTYGVLHDQVTYRLSPEYYHTFKFLQFRIDAGLRNAFGAGLVGFLATWWMGLVIAVPIAGLCLLFRDLARANRTFWLAAGLTVVITAAAGIVAFVASGSIAEVDTGVIPWMPGVAGTALVTNDPAAIWFVRVGWMHNGAYLGGGLGLLLGLALTGIRLRHDRRL